MYNCKVRLRGSIFEESYMLEDWTDAPSKFATDLALSEGSYNIVLEVTNFVTGFKRVYDLVHRVN